MAYKVIRASEDYQVVVVELDEKGRKRFFHINGYVGLESFEEITANKSIDYFSGMADGMGLGELPKQAFNSLEKVDEWREKARGKAQRAAAEKSLTRSMAWLNKEIKKEKSEKRKKELESLRKECLEALQELRENKK